MGLHLARPDTFVTLRKKYGVWKVLFPAPHSRHPAWASHPVWAGGRPTDSRVALLISAFHGRGQPGRAAARSAPSHGRDVAGSGAWAGRPGGTCSRSPPPPAPADPARGGAALRAAGGGQAARIGAGRWGGARQRRRGGHAASRAEGSTAASRHQVPVAAAPGVPKLSGFLASARPGRTRTEGGGVGQGSCKPGRAQPFTTVSGAGRRRDSTPCQQLARGPFLSPSLGGSSQMSPSVRYCGKDPGLEQDPSAGTGAQSTSPADVAETATTGGMALACPRLRHLNHSVGMPIGL